MYLASVSSVSGRDVFLLLCWQKAGGVGVSDEKVDLTWEINTHLVTCPRQREVKSTQKHDKGEESRVDNYYYILELFVRRSCSLSLSH